jgi:hypothetical protein
MTKKSLLTLTTALMLGVAPAAVAQQTGQTQQGQTQTQAQQGQTQAQQGQLRQMSVSDLLDRQVVDQQDQQIGTVSGVVRRDGQDFVEIERRDSDRIDLLPLDRVTVRDNQVVAQVQDGRITGAQEATEERRADFDEVEDDQRVQVRQQQAWQQDQQRQQFGQQQQDWQRSQQPQQFGQQQQDWQRGQQPQQFGQQQQDWQRGQQPQQFGQQQQDWQRQDQQQQFGQRGWQQDEQRFTRQGWQQDQQRQQFGQQQLENALRQAGFSQIQRVDQNVLQARGPDGRSIFVHIHDDAMATGGLGQQQWRQGQQGFGQTGQQFGQDQQQRWGQQ